MLTTKLGNSFDLHTTKYCNFLIFVLRKLKRMKIAVNAIILFLYWCRPVCSLPVKKTWRVETIWYNGSYNRDFNDLNDVQLAVAQKIGIEPISNREDAEHASKRCRRSKPAIIMKWKN